MQQVLPAASYTPRHKLKFMLVDSWLNFNLGAVTPAGIIAAGRFVFGRELGSLVGNAKKGKTTILIAAGLGYQFNKHLRVMAYYEHFRRTVNYPLHNPFQRDPDDNNNIYIKTEASF